MPSYVRAGIRKCARIRALSSNYKGLHEWITEIIDQMQATQKK